ncbi:MAG: OmpH family outer membrane protein [Gammaproteobacteria bacterium]|nr:OmpH family outer membrane protein [Gammaproteobacteria bacterium]
MDSKRSAILVGVMLTFLTFGAAHAQQLKIGYVDVVKVIEQAPQGDAALKILEAEFGPRDRELRDDRDKLKSLEEDLERNALVWKESERRDKERDIRDLRRELKRETQEFREDYNLRRNEELGSLQKIVYKAIVDIAKREEFDLVLHQGAVFASDRIDITQEVLGQLDDKGALSSDK